MTQQKNGTLNTIGAIASGGVIGAGLVLLFAPKSGRKTRRSLAHLGRKTRRKVAYYRSELSDGIDHIFRNIQEDMKSCIGDGKHWTEDQMSRIEHALQNGRKKIEEEVDRVIYS